ncbi:MULTISPECIES: hypothetical protein [Acidovorax]|uniref:Uncharacterized protein n=1 Tax=Acidovorax facilis TaxID=12917 RepID=A0ABV8DI79_9BURK|nr:MULTISPECIES: hypothetical protein [Acidovorax]MBO1010401.1 hypothetical protein [Acidovorax sp. SD340]MCO4244166.1 hypothetical protein [Acidovorax facilis]
MIVAANISALHVLEFSASIAPNTLAYEVSCQPTPDKPLNDCFPIVAEQVVARGGQQIFGWALWELPGVFIEAEFHSVWKSPEGDVVDLVPRLRPFTEIAFVPDASRRYENRQVDNIRKQLVNDNDVKRFLFLCKRRFAILNAGERALQHALILPKADMRELEANEKESMRLERRIYKRYAANF